jgi:hypothetical protein
MSKETEKTVGTNYGKCPVCNNPLEQTYYDSINGTCAERELECNFCLSYEYLYNYGNVRETIAWCQWEYSGMYIDLVPRTYERYERLGKSKTEQQKEFINTFRQYFERWRERKEFPPMFADWLQEEMFGGDTNEMLDLIRLRGFVLIDGGKKDRLSLPTGLIRSKG